MSTQLEESYYCIQNDEGQQNKNKIKNVRAL